MSDDTDHGRRADARLVVRPARPGDAAAIARVQRESWRTSYTGILPLEVVNGYAGERDTLWRKRLANQAPGGEAAWVALRQGAIVGFSFGGPPRDKLHDFDAEIYALYVLQDHQRRGVGRELVRAAARHFVREGLFGFYLWVLKANRARMFYEAIGGEEVGEKSERLGSIGHVYPQVAYGWHDLTDLVVDPDE